MNGRRLARFCVMPELVALMGRGRFEVVDNPLPTGARIVSSGYDAARDVFFVVLEHETFAPVAPGEVIPEVAAPTIRILGDRRPWIGCPN